MSMLWFRRVRGVKSTSRMDGFVVVSWMEKSRAPGILWYINGRVHWLDSVAGRKVGKGGGPEGSLV